MSSIAVTSAVSSSMPINKVSFTCKIANFGCSVKNMRKEGFYSPEMKVVSYHGGQEHSFRLLFKKYIPHECIYNFIGITENGVEKSMEDFTPIQISLINRPKTIQFGLAGSLSFEMSGRMLSGSFGNADSADFSKFWDFGTLGRSTARTHHTHKTALNAGLPLIYCYTGFIVDNRTQTLLVNVELTIPGVVANSISILPSLHKVIDSRTATLLCDIKKLLDNADESSDFTIICSGKSFPCHEVILAARSPVFKSMFQLNMQEKTSRKLTVEDVGIKSISALLEFLYTGEITQTDLNEAELIYLGDKYDIQGLLELTLRKLPQLHDSKIKDILFVANRHNLEDFKKVAMQRVLSNKTKFIRDEEFLSKLKQTPDLLMELFKL